MNIFTAFLLLIIGAVSACIMVLLELQYKHYLKQKQIDDFSKSRIIKVQMNKKENNSRNSDLGKQIHITNVVCPKKLIYSWNPSCFCRKTVWKTPGCFTEKQWFSGSAILWIDYEGKCAFYGKNHQTEKQWI